MPDGAQVSIWLAFGAGVLSILSPCCLALVPAYITYLTGTSAVENEQRSTWWDARVMWNALCFVAGFSILFVLYGASASLLGHFLLENQTLIRKLAGLLVFLFGLHTTGLVEIPGLERERRLTLKVGDHRGGVRSSLVGMAFAAGWTPCVGPILGSIVLMASSTSTVYAGMWLLLAYSLGMGIPFLLMALFIGRFRVWMPAIRRHSRTISLVTGILLMGIGVMLYTNAFVRLAGMFNYYNRLGW